MSSKGNSASCLFEVVKRGHLRKLGENRTKETLNGTEFDFEFLKVANSAVQRKIPTAIVLPVTGSNTSILLSAIILIDHLVRTEKIAAQVALATKQLRLRSFYDSLYIRREHLSDYFPRTIVSENRVSKIGERPSELFGRPGRLHFLSELSRLDRVRDNLNGIVIEATAAEDKKVRAVLDEFNGRIPVIYLATNPNDPIINYFNEYGVVWAWDEARLQYLIDGSKGESALCAELERLKGAAQTQYGVFGPEEETEMDEALRCLWGSLRTIQHHPGGLTFDSVRWVWGVFNAYSQLVIPVSYYDRFSKGAWKTSVLENASGKALSFAKNTIKKGDGEYWSIIADDLEKIYSIAQANNPKESLLVEKIQSLKKENDDNLILLKNEAFIRAARAFLNESSDVPFGWEENIKLKTLNEYQKGRITGTFSTIIVSGPVPTRYSGLLALPTSRILTTLAHGPWEAGRAVKQIKQVNTRLKSLAYGKCRARAMGKLGIDPSSSRDIKKGIGIDIKHSKVSSVLDESEEHDTIWDPFDVEVVGDLGKFDEEAEGPAKFSRGGIRGKVEVLKIELNDGVVFFEPNLPVTKITEGGDRKIAAKSLEKGDKILLIERSSRKDLFDVVTDKLDQLPEFQARTKLIKEWKDRVKKAGNKFDFNYEKILNLMEGTALTSPHTIMGWILGYVNGPQDPEDVRRFGEAVDDDFLKAHWDKVAKALATMRKHHRKIGRKLSKSLRNLSSEEVTEEEYFDRRLGIHYSDLLEAVSIHSVKSASDTLLEITYQCVNRLLEDEELSLVEESYINE